MQNWEFNFKINDIILSNVNKVSQIFSEAFSRFTIKIRHNCNYSHNDLLNNIINVLNNLHHVKILEIFKKLFIFCLSLQQIFITVFLIIFGTSVDKLQLYYIPRKVQKKTIWSKSNKREVLFNIDIHKKLPEFWKSICSPNPLRKQMKRKYKIVFISLFIIELK